MLKKISLMIALVAIVSSVSFGQIKFGVKGGLNMSNIKISGGGMSVSNKMHMGFMVGGFAVYSINDKLAIQPELMFAQYGCKMDKDLYGSSDDLKFVENYISLPIMVNYSLGAIILQAGPQLGYLVSAKLDGDDAMDGMKKIDFGIAVGAGYEMENGLGVAARYYLGLANTMEDTGSATVKNNAIQLMVSYKFK